MSKYYTPTIEEFHVGFEFEMDDTWGGWKKLTLTEELLKNPSVALGSGNERVPYYHNTRVKYLDKEDIESLDFTYKTTDEKTDLFINFKWNISIIYNFETKVLRMITMDLVKSELYHEIHTDPHRIGGIIIKNKSEFNKLLTQLHLI